VQNLCNTRLGQYELIEIIGRGRMSTVYKAYQPSLRRFVAIKVFQNLDILAAARFEREAQMVAQLHHPNILTIFDYGHQEHLRYFVMQYVEHSVSLSDLLVRQPIEPIAALQLMKHLLAGLAYAHGRGIIHRDIKPSNILLPFPDWPLLADFGIAKLLDDLRHLTPPGQTVGTAAYMAPELARGLPVDSRADLYSVGVVLYQLLTGQAPFEAITPSAVLQMHIHVPPPPPRSLNQELPPEVEALLLRALAKDPADRYQSADEMAEAVEQVTARLEQEYALAELLGSSSLASEASSYTTRKLEPDPPPASAAAPTIATDASSDEAPEHLDAQSLQATAMPRSRRSRAAGSARPLFVVVFAISVIGGMLVAYLLRSYALEDRRIPEPASTAAAQTPTTLPVDPQGLNDRPTLFPAVLPGQQVDPAAPTIPVAPPQPTAPILPPESLPTATPADLLVPTLPPVPSLSATLEPSTAALTPVPPAQVPTESLPPSTTSD
jgi:serine/threonine protein kinase